MIHNSNDTLPNALYSANSKKSDKNTTMLTPIREGTLNFLQLPRTTSRNISTANTKVSSTGTLRKSIKIIKPETIKRANNDAWMAAAIGDLEWLKNSLKISSEIVFDKNGYATLHLACIHGRLNIIKYLIEGQNMSINLPSSQGWCPISLCINNNIGSKAVDCLKYLISKGADINVKNNNGTCPMHMAASEGQVECLKILLELKADTKLKDNRDQTPLDLAKLWGHRNCAKYLNNEIWCSEKAQLTHENLLDRQMRSQGLLKQVQSVYESYYEDKEDSEKNFESWLVSQVDVQEVCLGSTLSKENDAKSKSGSNSTVKLADAQSKDKHNPSPTKSKAIPESANSYKSSTKLKPVVNILKSDLSWNFSGKICPKAYTSNLTDFFPRDYYTCLPTDAELLFLNKELKGQSMDKVKNLIKKDFSGLNNTSNSENNGERVVVFKPKSVLDVEAKALVDTCAGRGNKNTPQSYGSYYNTNGTLKQIKRQLSADVVGKHMDEKLKFVERVYGKDLSNYMMDSRNGKMSQKYEKVFIC